MSPPQLNGSGMSFQVEPHLSLVSTKFDFTLIKVEPPAEYRDIGPTLSRPRFKEAETGEFHATASNLGVLFDGIVPAVPNLIRAYGLRSSEVANSTTYNPRGSSSHGLFADEVGIDGRAIWSAATSGTSSIAVHLLACMLARMWSQPQAISIWMELISMRKRDLAASGKRLDFEASKIEFSRDQISKWQASAEAWRQTADQANATRQTQLLLIIDHLGMPASCKIDLGESVIDAWRTAMITIDKLVAGLPQSVQTGAPLLGLAAWHLYPDMVVFGKDKEVKEIKQKDPLISRGGLLTLGIEDTRRRGDGIFWSLPLAHMRYYGDPVQAEACLSTRTSRVSVDQLVYVAIGSLIRRWCADFDDIALACSLIAYMNAYISTDNLSLSTPGWLPMLASAAEQFANSDEKRRTEILQLIKCGRRRYPAFIDHPGTDPIFGLSNPTAFMGLLDKEHARITLLRKVAKDFSDDRRLLIIQCKLGTRWALVSVENLESLRSDTSDNQAKSFLIWVEHNVTAMLEYHEDSSYVSVKEWIPWWGASDTYHWPACPRSIYVPLLREVSTDQTWESARAVNLTARFLFGDKSTAALYSVGLNYWTLGPNYDGQIIKEPPLRPLPNVFILRHVVWAMKEALPDASGLAVHLYRGEYRRKERGRGDEGRVLTSLRALYTVYSLYQGLSNAVIELAVASRPLFGHNWIPNDQISDPRGPFHLTIARGPFHLTREQNFACIVHFDSGKFNIPPSAMTGVLAISSGNSMYVARCLLRDPCDADSLTAIDRIIGNLGTSGMAMLMAPESARVRPMSHEYALINHHQFDCKEENSFQRTTLHMNLTEWKLPVDVGSRGIRDVEAYYVEGAIGVYDHGKWVADVNILDVFENKLARIVPACGHEKNIPRARVCEFVAIDNWEELLDSPLEVGVFRARGNWQARLAAAALSVHQQHETRIIHEEACWQCRLDLPSISSEDSGVDEEGYADDSDDMFEMVYRSIDDEGTNGELDGEMEGIVDQQVEDIVNSMENDVDEGMEDILRTIPLGDSGENKTWNKKAKETKEIGRLACNIIYII